MIIELIDKLERSRSLERDEYLALLTYDDDRADIYLRERARLAAWDVFHGEVKARGLIEISNYCKNNCLYPLTIFGNPKVSAGCAFGIRGGLNINRPLEYSAGKQQLNM